MRMLFGMLVSACVALPAAAPAQDIVDVAAGNPNFSTLVAAVKAAGLVDTLKGPGPFTVFAPTNEAFANLPPGTLDDLLKPENKSTLTAILTYHVVPGAVKAADVVKLDGQNATTVEGRPLPIRFNGESVRVGDATVVQTDIEATNGVIHVIDTVLLPPAPAPAAAIPATPATPATVYNAAPMHPTTATVIHAAPVMYGSSYAAPVYYAAPATTYTYPSYYAMPTYSHRRMSSCGR